METSIKNLKLRTLFFLIQAFQASFPRFSGYLSSIIWFAPFDKKAGSQRSELLNTAQTQLIEGIEVHSWGRSDFGRTIVLVHGWGGRWDQFGSMIPFLVSHGYHVLSFDLPAHGQTKGFSTSIPEWIPFFKTLELFLKVKPIYICHSFGFMTVNYLIRHTQLSAAGIIAINSPSTFHFIIEQFSRRMKLNQETIQYLLQNVKNRVGRDVEEMITVPFRWLQEKLPLFMIADINDREVPFSQHFEARLVLKEHFFTTQNLGHVRILQDKTTHTMILELLSKI